ncbi:MAG: hypothetical protein IPN57_18010 [Ignavibacteria bacterium]|nr:hypothetical protein [Ignavibacteria bacterium]
MRKFYSAFRLIFLCIIIINSGKIFGQGFNSITTPDGSNLVAVGNSGKLYRSASAGVSWVSYTNGALNMNCVTSLDNDVWIASDNGTVYRTLKTVSTINSYTVGSSVNLYSVHFINANTGFVCGDAGNVYKTVNGGVNWATSNTGISSVKLNSINFKDANNGTVVGNNGSVYVTSDGGASWIAQTSGTSYNLLKVKYFNDSLVAAGEYGTLINNTSGLWTGIPSRINTDIKGITGMNMNDVHICGGGGFIRNNRSGSSAFLKFEVNPMMANLTDVFYYDNNKGWAVSSLNSVIIYTTNGGTNWTMPAGSTVSMNWVSKAGATGTSLGDNLCVHPNDRNTIFTAFTNQIYVSRNRGESWTAVGTTMPSSSTPHSFFVSPVDTNIWLCTVEAATDKIMRTTNYGATWNAVLTMNFSNYGEPLQIDQNNPSVFYFGPDNGGFYKSTDNGATFSEISGNYPFRSPCDIMVTYDNSNMIFLADGITSSGVADLFKSVNGGVNWTKVFSNPSSSEIPTMSNTVFDNTIAYATNWPGSDIYKTTNSGDNWFLNNTNSFSGWGSDICKEDPNVIMSGSWSGGSTSLSTNGGVNWISTSGLSGSGGVMEIIERGYIVAQAGSNVYKLNITYTDSPVLASIDVQSVSLGNTGIQYFPGSTIIPSGTVKNNNAAESATFTVTRKISPGNYVSTKSVSALGPALSANVNFDQWTFISGTAYTIKDSVYIAGDAVTSNDVLSGSITPYTGQAVNNLDENFSGVYPPLNWSFIFSGTNYWKYNAVSSYGTGTGSDQYDFWNSPATTIQSMLTPTFTAAVSGDSLVYDYAYAPFTSGTDSLILETSTDGGTSYTTFIKLQGRASDVIGATNSLKTAATSSSIFTPTSSQWLTRKWGLPAGTNKIKFRARSASGNNLYLDNIKIKSSNLFTQFNIKLVPEGLYNGSNKVRKDTVKIYLRNISSPFAVVDSSTTFIDDANLVSACVFKFAASGTYYLQVIHRNSLEVWSKTGGESMTKGITGNYDFTSLQSQTYGNNSVLVGLKYCIPSGDVNQDGIIDASDVSEVDNNASISLSGYVQSDLNGDDFVDAADLSIVDNNSYLSLSLIRP